MAPEHSDGLDDYDVPSRTATAGEEFAVTMRRIIAYGGTNSASTPDGSMQRLGTVTTLAGRRSARLSSLAATGGGIAAEDPETQAELLHTLQVEQEVKARLRAELPPRDDDWSESGGDVLPGAQFEVDVRSEDVYPTHSDGEEFVDDENDPESSMTYSVPTVTTTTPCKTPTHPPMVRTPSLAFHLLSLMTASCLKVRRSVIVPTTTVVWSVSRKARLREHLLMKLFARLMTLPVAPPLD